MIALRLMATMTKIMVSKWGRYISVVTRFGKGTGVVEGETRRTAGPKPGISLNKTRLLSTSILKLYQQKIGLYSLGKEKFLGTEYGGKDQDCHSYKIGGLHAHKAIN
jgi:hypothetical protein